MTLKSLKYFFCTAMLFCILGLVYGCKENRKFKAEAVFDGIGSQNVMVYYSDNGALTSYEDAVIDSKITIEGELVRPAVIEIYDNSHKLMGRFVAAPGEDELTVRFKPGSPWVVSAKGDPLSEEMASFYAKNANTLDSGDMAEINSLISNYIDKHNESALSALLLYNIFNADLGPEEAVRLQESLEGEALSLPDNYHFVDLLKNRTEVSIGDKMPELQAFNTNDSTIFFSPSSGQNYIYCFEDRTQLDTMKIKPFQEMKDITLVDIRMRPDTFGWRRNIVPKLPSQSVALHIPKSMADEDVRKANVYFIPFYIAVDTAGIQVYRGPSIEEAADALK